VLNVRSPAVGETVYLKLANSLEGCWSVTILGAAKSSATIGAAGGALAQGFADQIGDIGAIIQWILAAVFFTLMLVTGNTIAQSVRERTNELAVLKTVGFSDGKTLALVLAESGLIAILGGGIGLLLGSMAVGAGDPTGGFLPIFYFPTKDLLWGIAFVLMLGVIAGMLPAVQAMRLRIVDALRRA
jgi:putative ABC transport system permease protein